VAVPLTKLATADIYRRLEWRAPASVGGGKRRGMRGRENDEILSRPIAAS